MAEQNPPIFIQAGTHPAEDVRRYMDALAAGREGIIGSGDLAVSENGAPNMSVNVAAGRALIAGSQSASQGLYAVDSRSTENIAIDAADGSLARKDLIVAKVQDQSYSGPASAWSLAAVTGTPAASPAEPTVPDNCMVLAMVDVPAGDTSITNAQITDRRTSTSGQGRASSLGGVVVCTSTTRPSHAAGRMIYETDTGLLQVSNGSSWGGLAPTTFSTIRKTSDESVTLSTTLQNDNELLLPVLASTNYLVDAWIATDGGNVSGPNIKLGWSGPAGATMRWGYHAENDLSDADDVTWTTAIGNNIGAHGGDWPGDDLLILVHGILSVSSTAGNLQFRWAQYSASDTATRVFRGSILRLTPVT